MGPLRGLGRSSQGAPSHAGRSWGAGRPASRALGTAAVAEADKELLATGGRRVRAPSLYFAQWREIGAVDRAACDLGGARAGRGAGSALRGPEGREEGRAGSRGAGVTAGVGRGRDAAAGRPPSWRRAKRTARPASAMLTRGGPPLRPRAAWCHLAPCVSVRGQTPEVWFVDYPLRGLAHVRVRSSLKAQAQRNHSVISGQN